MARTLNAKGLILENITKTFGDYPAVLGLSLHVAPGEVVCLLGPSGCGKTTSLRVAAGLEEPEEGKVILNGKPVSGDGVFLPPEERNIGLVFQDFALFPHLDVQSNVAFGLIQVPVAERKALAAEAIERVGLSALAGAYPHMLSGGEQQRVALARALAPAPSVLLMDEPFSGLDKRLRDAVRDDTISALRSSKTATLLVTHEPDEAMRMADRIALMRAGALVQEGSPVDLYERPVDREAAAFFGQVNICSGVVEAGVVQTAFGPMVANDIADGNSAEICIRPQGFTRVEEGGVNAIARHVRFIGTHTQIEAEVAGIDQLVIVSLPDNVEITPGAEILLAAKSGAAMVFPLVVGN